MRVLDDMEGLFTVLDPFADEGEEHSVLLVLAVEERTDVPRSSENRPRQPHLWRHITHDVSPRCRAGTTSDSTMYGMAVGTGFSGMLPSRPRRLVVSRQAHRTRSAYMEAPPTLARV